MRSSDGVFLWVFIPRLDSSHKIMGRGKLYQNSRKISNMNCMLELWFVLDVLVGMLVQKPTVFTILGQGANGIYYPRVRVEELFQENHV